MKDKLTRGCHTENDRENVSEKDVKCSFCRHGKDATLAKLPDEELKFLDNASKSIKFDKNQIMSLSLRMLDQNRDGFYCIQDGYVGLYSFHGNFDLFEEGKSLDEVLEHSQVISLFGPTEIVGFGHWQSRRPRFLRALTPGLACFFEYDRFKELESTSLELNKEISNYLVKTINAREEQLLSLEHHSVKNRVAGLLLFLNSKFGRPSEFGSEIGVKFDREILAQLTGTVPETLARILGALEDEKLIKREKRLLHLVDIEGLRRASQEN